MPQEKNNDDPVYYVYFNEKIYKKGEFMLAVFGSTDQLFRPTLNQQVNNYTISYEWSRNSSFLDVTDFLVSNNNNNNNTQLEKGKIINYLSIYYISNNFFFQFLSLC